MRVRYKFFSDSKYTAQCDMTIKNANEIYEKLCSNPMCLWGELICEDDNEVDGYSYMDVVKGFDHDYEFAKWLHSLGAIESI